MIFDPSTAVHLKPWLVRTLEPICDAEPGALSDYILALLKHNVPENEMRKELATQLEEFLEKECPSFIDVLFKVLRTKSYLPYAAPPSPVSGYGSTTADAGIPIPLDALLSPGLPSSPDLGLKRSFQDDDHNSQPSAKTPRLRGGSHFARHANGKISGDRRSSPGWTRPHEMRGRQGIHPQGGRNTSPGTDGLREHTNGRQSYVYSPVDQRKGICRDYHNNGYCARGALCRFSHGDDAVIPGQLFSMNGPPMAGPGLPFLPMFAPGPLPFPISGPGGAYDPHEAQMDMRPISGVIGPGGGRAPRVPMVPRNGQEDHGGFVGRSGELPVIQDLTPTDGRQDTNDPSMPGDDTVPPISSSIGAESRLMEVDLVNSMVPPLVPFNPPQYPRFTRRTRDGFSGEAHNFHPERRDDKTLVVEKIPEDKLTLEAVNEWFKRFGIVTHVAVDARNAKALVSFSDHKEAHTAWKSEDAIFNNRFVKVFWHRPLEGHGQAGARMLAASAPLVANIAAKDANSSPAKPPETIFPANISTPVRKAPTASAAAAAIAAKKELLDRQISEQKSLMKSLEGATPEQKKAIMASLRKLREEMDSSNIILPSSRAEDSLVPSQHEQKEKERLDKELEMHSARIAEDNAEDLRNKLSKLKAEAASLGLPEALGQSPHPSSYRGYRGRGRGMRAYPRGVMRGGHLRSSMTLDNRPKKLVVKGIQEADMHVLKDWYETTGQLESVDKLDGIGAVVAFKTRNAAEQGLAKGQIIPRIGQVSITWLTGSVTDNSANRKSSPVPDAENLRSLDVPNSTFQAQDDEVAASGWGGYGDEGDGMGML